MTCVMTRQMKEEVRQGIKDRADDLACFHAHVVARRIAGLPTATGEGYSEAYNKAYDEAFLDAYELAYEQAYYEGFHGTYEEEYDACYRQAYNEARAFIERSRHRRKSESRPAQ
jgi:hypothetical protein